MGTSAMNGTSNTSNTTLTRVLGVPDTFIAFGHQLLKPKRTSQLITVSLSQWTLKKTVWTLFSLLNIRHPKKFKPFSHWPSKKKGRFRYTPGNDHISLTNKALLWVDNFPFSQVGYGLVPWRGILYKSINSQKQRGVPFPYYSHISRPALRFVKWNFKRSRRPHLQAL